jgi:hypothetical protein
LQRTRRHARKTGYDRVIERAEMASDPPHDMSEPTPSQPAAWSTPKFLLVALVVSFVVMFTLNGVLNEILGLGISGAAFGAANGVVLVALLPRWTVFRKIVQRRQKGA